jgi:hypothetical protein
MLRSRLFAAAAIALACTVSHAADKQCTQSDKQRAMKVIDAVVSWPQLYRAYLDFHHCDSGGDVSDQFADALLRLTVDWKDVKALSAGMAKDAGYKAFVQAHLKAATKDDRDAVYSRAKTHCPAGEDAFCAELAEVTKPQ